MDDMVVQFYTLYTQAFDRWQTSPNNCDRMAWQWAETLVEIRGNLADINGTTKYGCRYHFQAINLTSLYV